MAPVVMMLSYFVSHLFTACFLNGFLQLCLVSMPVLDILNVIRKGAARGDAAFG